MSMSVTVRAYSYSVFNCIFTFGGELDLVVNFKIRTAVFGSEEWCRFKANLANAISTHQNLRYNIWISNID